MSLVENPTDIEDRVARALVAILSADAGVLALCRPRTDRLVVPWGTEGATPTPVLVYEIGPIEEIGGAGDNRRMTCRLTAFAEGNGARSTTAALIERVEIAVTQPALAAQGLDAAPMGRRRFKVPTDAEASPSLARSDIELTLWVTK